MNHKFASGMLYVRHRALPVRDAEWTEMMNEIARHAQNDTPMKILVRTDNAGPNVVQRSDMNALLESKGVQLTVAVLSSSVVVRGIITAFSWMRRMNIRSFGQDDYTSALAYLDVKVRPADAKHVMTEIEQIVG
jgi:hypothetical protein